MSRLLAHFALVLSILLLTAPFLTPQAVFAQGKAYRVGPTDVLTLTIYAGGEKQAEVDMTVSAQGGISVPFIGVTRAAGLTPSELEARITGPLAEDYFVDPRVSIRVKEYHSLHYYISGAVKGPGLYETTTEVSLLELIAKAGGLQPECGDLAYIMTMPTEEGNGNRMPAKVDLKSLLEQGDMSANVMLESGDVVYIPLQRSLDLAESKVYVEGEVKNPGMYEHHPGLTAMNACIMAGGFAEFAAPNRTRIIRKQGDELEIIKINLNQVKDGKIPDVELQPGDRIHVPETWL